MVLHPDRGYRPWCRGGAGMKEFRRVVIDTESDSRWHVGMGVIPNTPGWHQELYKNSSYAFPTRQAADLFADNHRRMYPGRVINVDRG